MQLFHCNENGIDLAVQVIPSSELAAAELPLRMATNLLRPAAKHFQSPADGMLKSSHSTPSELYRAALPPVDTTTNLPLAANASSPVP